MKFISVVLAHNAARPIELTVRDYPRGTVDEIIVVNDASTGNIADVARRLGFFPRKSITYGAYAWNDLDVCPSSHSPAVISTES